MIIVSDRSAALCSISALHSDPKAQPSVREVNPYAGGG